MEACERCRLTDMASAHAPTCPNASTASTRIHRHTLSALAFSMAVLQKTPGAPTCDDLRSPTAIHSNEGQQLLEHWFTTEVRGTHEDKLRIRNDKNPQPIHKLKTPATLGANGPSQLQRHKVLDPLRLQSRQLHSSSGVCAASISATQKREPTKGGWRDAARTKHAARTEHQIPSTSKHGNTNSLLFKHRFGKIQGNELGLLRSNAKGR